MASGPDDARVVAYLRPERGGLLALANVSEGARRIAAARFGALPARVPELLTGRVMRLDEGLVLEPYEVMWLDLR